MADLTPEQIGGLARSVDIYIDQSLCVEVGYDFNAMTELLNQVNPEGLEIVEPLPIIPFYQDTGHDQD